MTTIVLICGWFNANPRHVQKYAALYEEKGYKTYTIYSGRGDFWIATEKIHATTMNEFKTWLSTQKIEGSFNIMPHIFSNGGCRSWYCFEQHLASSGISYRIPGIILDSAPTKLHAWEFGHRAMTANIKNTAIRHTLAGFVWICSAFLSLVVLAFGGKSPLDLQYKKIIQRDAGIPKLFLYSNGDTMITEDHIEATIADARALETDVTVVKFKDSKHVAHLTSYPELYSNAVHDFIVKYSPENAAANAH